MQTLNRAVGLLVAVIAFACGGSAATSGQGGTGKVVKSDAERFVGSGISVTRPQGWSFAPVDSSVSKDAVVVLVGPRAEGKLAATVELARRPIATADRRRSPEALLTAISVEMMQAYAACEATASPTAVTVAGRPGATLKLKLTETLPEGGEVERVAQLYVTTTDDALIVLRSFLPTDNSSDADLDAILASLAIEAL